MTQVCLFEDREWRGLLPLTWLHPAWELLCGARTGLARVRAAFPSASLWAMCRPWLEAVVRERSGMSRPGPGGPMLFVNGRTVDVGVVAACAREVSGPFALWSNEVLVAFRVEAVPSGLPPFDELVQWARSLNLPPVTRQVRMVRRWWDLVYLNGEMLREDLHDGGLGVYEGTVMSGSHLLDPSRITVGPLAQIEPGVVIDSRSGPVVIERGARIGANSLVVGPAFIGKDSLVKPMSQLGPEVSIGPCCRVGGEVARSVFLGYGNKQHDGFVGHAYVGSWVNLGAGTTNSNLKNTYGRVKVWVDGRFEDSGLTFIGCAIGDHAKTAIGTTLNTGTVIGVCANVFTTGFPPRFVPSFSWGPAPGREFDLAAALTTAARVMERRGLELTSAEATLLKEVWARTASERLGSDGGIGD